MTDHTKLVLAMERAAGPLAATALENFVSLNPHWRGAKFADVLSEMHNGDAFCDEVDSFFDEPDRPTRDPEVVALAVITLAAAKMTVTVKAVYDLVDIAQKEIA